jgi:mannosyltransferase OCH1-like enzyme
MAIPKKIWQTCNFEESDIPEYIEVIRRSWIDLNPGWEYQYMSEKDCIEFLDQHYGPDRVDAYRGITKGALKGDYWRFHCIAKFGGVYADIDARCLAPLDSWFDPSKSFVGCKEFDGDGIYTFCSWFFGSTAGNLWVSEIADIVHDRVFSSARTTDGKFFTASILETYYSYIDYMKNLESLESFRDAATVYDQADIRQLVEHKSASWDHCENDSEFREIPESYYWDCGDNVNLKIYNNGYSSASLPGKFERS